MSRRLAIVLVISLVLLLGAHEIALRLLVDYEVAGALLAVGGSADTLLAAAGTLLLRLLTVLVVTCLPAVAIALTARRRI